MKFTNVRIFGNQNNPEIEFVYPSYNLLMRLASRLSKKDNVKTSKLGDGAAVYTPKNDMDFISAINNLKIDPINANMEHLIIWYDKKNDVVKDAQQINTESLINLASKKYGVAPEYLGSFEATCRDYWLEQRSTLMSKNKNNLFHN